MPPKLTEEQRILAYEIKAEKTRAWKIANREKFEEYMHNYYLQNKDKLNKLRGVNAKKKRHQIKAEKTAQPDNNV